MTSLSKFFKERQYSQLAALLLLVLLLLIGAVPGYLTGNWQWKQPPAVPTLKELREIRKAGLSVPGWQTIKQEEREIGERKWSLQTIQKEGTNTEAILLILPQNGPMDQPQAARCLCHCADWSAKNHFNCDGLPPPFDQAYHCSTAKVCCLVEPRKNRAFTFESVFAPLALSTLTVNSASRS